MKPHSIFLASSRPLAIISAREGKFRVEELSKMVVLSSSSSPSIIEQLENCTDVYICRDEVTASSASVSDTSSTCGSADGEMGRRSFVVCLDNLTVVCICLWDSISSRSLSSLRSYFVATRRIGAPCLAFSRKSLIHRVTFLRDYSAVQS